MSKRKFIGLVAGRQLPVMECDALGEWLIWIDYDKKREAGTYIRLRPNGEAYREVLSSDGTITNVMRIK